MPKLSHALFSVMKRIDGAKFYGHVTSSSTVSTKEKAPYRVLHARRPTFLIAGDVVISHGGEVIILMEHPDDFYWAKSFKAVYALEKITWKRPTYQVDPVSKVKKDLGVVDMGSLYVNFDTPEELNVEGIEDTKYRFITGQDVQVNDKVGDYVVKRVIKSLGVKVAYAA